MNGKPDGKMRISRALSPTGLGGEHDLPVVKVINFPKSPIPIQMRGIWCRLAPKGPAQQKQAVPQQSFLKELIQGL
jgi:hypothetical protein